MKNENQKDRSWWIFGTINGRLVEFHYKIRNRKLHTTYGHCYVRREKYSKAEQRMIDGDTKKYRFTFRDGKYKRVNAVV